jgi:hypothetical protein
MLARVNAQTVIFILIVGFVVFYYFNTAGQLEVFKNQVSCIDFIFKFSLFFFYYVVQMFPWTEIYAKTFTLHAQ